MFYESNHPQDADYFMMQSKSNFNYPLHIHSCFEILVITAGEMAVTVDAKTKIMHENEVALIFPNQAHSLKTQETSRHTLCVFSGHLVNFFFKKTKWLLPEENFFVLPPHLVSAFAALGQTDDICYVKGILYTICGIFHQSAVYRPVTQSKTDALLLRILSYIEVNYTTDCSLEDLSKALSYDYAYLSKYFKKSTGMTFGEYVNRRRVSDACHLLETTDLPVFDIGMACGYGSLRSMNRNFRKITGHSPGEYKHIFAGSAVCGTAL